MANQMSGTEKLEQNTEDPSASTMELQQDKTLAFLNKQRYNQASILRHSKACGTH